MSQVVNSEIEGKLINLVGARGGLTATEIARQLKLHPATVRKVLADLSQMGFTYYEKSQNHVRTWYLG